ncbi:MAG: prenyltransferase/squalene oxidase repeat-containing protein [Planctomycetota bacterium]
MAHRAFVAHGLEYLSEHQPGGCCWVGDVGHKQENDYLVLDEAARQLREGDGKSASPRCAGWHSWPAATCRGAASTAPWSSERSTVLRCENTHGYITDSGTRMYDHAFATLFLTQVFGMQRRRNFQEQLERAVGLIADSQNEQGGWRYNPFVVEADLSVTVCQLQALRAARNVGINVPRTVIDRAVAYVRRSRIDGGREDGCYYYKIEGRAARTKTSFAINAAAITSLMSAGIYDHEDFEPAVRYIENRYEEITDDFPDHFYFWYGNYYAVQVLLHVGGRRWERYFGRLRDDLLKRQREDGSWDNTVGPGPAFATAMACLLLEIPRQILPIFQK